MKKPLETMVRDKDPRRTAYLKRLEKKGLPRATAYKLALEEKLEREQQESPRQA